MSDVFERALESPGTGREQLVRELLVDRPALVNEVLNMLRIAESDDPRLRGASRFSLANLQTEAEKNRSINASQSLRFGAYVAEQILGEGGMGTVYLAHHQQTQQPVAIKVLRQYQTGLSSVRQRFEMERQLLSTLHHPHVAQLLDVGQTEAGTPYLVMEYVDGERITEYCRSRKLSLRQRLKLFQSVLAAVAHAHGFGIVHRDLKPSNILVTSRGDVKLIDFGVAKVVAAAGLDLFTTLTVDGAAPMTPEYASPEQLQGMPVGVAADIYSLGVILYELLTESRPYHFQTRSPLAVAMVVNRQEPIRPSLARRASPVAAPDQPSVASRSDETATGLPTQSTRLRGDLDAIILKAIRKDPSHRYRSVAEFSDDIDRYFEGAPVVARQGARLYALGRFTQQHLAALASLALLILSLAVGLLVTRRAWQREREVSATNERLVKQKNLAVAEQKLSMGHVFDAYQILSSDNRESLLGESDWEHRYVFGKLLRQADTLSLRDVRHLPMAGNRKIRTLGSPDWLIFGSMNRFDSASMMRAWKRQDALIGQATPAKQQTVPYFLYDLVAMACSPEHDLICFAPLQGLGYPNYSLALREFDSGRELDMVDFTDFPVLKDVGAAGPLMFSLDGQQVASLHMSGDVILWSTADGKLKPVARRDLAEIGGYFLSYSPQGDRIAVGLSGASRLCVLDATSLEIVADVPLTVYPVALDWSPDGEHVILADPASNVMVFDADTGNKVVEWNEFVGVTALDTLADNEHVAVATTDTSIRMRRIRDGQLLHSFHVGGVPISDIEALDAEKKLLICELDGRVRFWPLRSLASPPMQDKTASVDTPRRWLACDRPPHWMFMHPTKPLVGVADDLFISIWDLQTQQLVQRFQCTDSNTWRVLFSPDGASLIISGWTLKLGNTLQIWDWETPERQHIDNGISPAVHASHSWIASIVGRKDGKQGTDLRWDVLDAGEIKRTHQVNLAFETDELSFAHQHPWLAMGGKQGELLLAELGSDMSLRTLWETRGHEQQVSRIIISPDDRYLASCAYGEHVVQIWDARTGERLRTVNSYALHQDGMITISPDSRRLCLVGDDGRVRLFDLETGVLSYESGTPTSAESNYELARFTPDGQSLVCISATGWMTVLEAPTESQYREGQSMLRRLWSRAPSTFEQGPPR